MLSLTATELPRFMACNGSRLMGGTPPVAEDNEVRNEGNAVHWMIEQVFKGNGTAEEYIDRKAPNGVYITEEMIEHSSEYLAAIMGRGEVECDTSYCNQGEYEVRGRADHRDFETCILYVDDFKYGWKIVEPERNWTLISHALSTHIHQPQKIPTEVVFRIFQPRPYHPEGSVRECRINYDQFRNLCSELIETLCNPSDELCTGEHCYKCQHMSQCPAAQIAFANSIDVAEMAFDNVVNNDTLAFMINQSERAMSVLKQNLEAYQDLAAARLKQGQVVKGFGLENALGQTEWNAGLTPELLMAMTGVDLRQKKLITPGQAQKLGVDTSVFAGRRSKGVKMVRVDAAKRAEKLFGKKG